jgi:hypothetical protein
MNTKLGRTGGSRQWNVKFRLRQVRLGLRIALQRILILTATTHHIMFGWVKLHSVHFRIFKNSRQFWTICFLKRFKLSNL